MINNFFLLELPFFAVLFMDPDTDFPHPNRVFFADPDPDSRKKSDPDPDKRTLIQNTE